MNDCWSSVDGQLQKQLVVNHKNNGFKFALFKRSCQRWCGQGRRVERSLGNMLLNVSSNEPNRRVLISNDNEGFVEKLGSCIDCWRSFFI